MIGRILALALCILLLLVPMTGCWDYVEYNDLAQIIAIGIDFDKETNNIVMSLQFIPTARPGRGSGSEEQSQNNGLVHTASDTTLFGALAKLQQVVDKNFFYGYAKILVIGEEAAKNVLLPMMEIHDRSPAIRASSFVVFTPGKAENILGTIDSSHSEIAGNTLSKLLETVSANGASFSMTIQKFIEMLSISGIEAVGPCAVTTVKELEVKGGTIDSIKANVQKEGKLMISGLAAFKGGSLVGWLDQKQSLGFGWITGKKINAYKFTGSVSGAISDEAYFRVSNTKSKVKVKLINGNVSIDIGLKVTCSLRKYYSFNYTDYLDCKDLNQLEAELSKSIKEDIEKALKKGQKELQSDIFGFGFEFYRKYPKLWNQKYEKEWDKIFPDVPVNIKVDARITNTGTNIRNLVVK
ncbi:MAG: Spore germination protein B3 precursor [Firmicutes bacterium ADurb.Bin419]|nr:MAG: Spore germination protein B3 precursor [Firmicutes bacterium ADurb.Bin419]